MKISLITICHNRQQHLHNLLVGLSRSTRLPDEVLIVTSRSLNLPDIFCELPIRQLILPTQTDEPFAIGAARNAGARAAGCPCLIFLDVDCIPAPDFIDKIMSQDASDEGLTMGTPRYLERTLPDSWQTEDLTKLSEFHPRRPVLDTPRRREANYALFWSLCFALSQDTFARMGGFDERFRGYGAEDTDFAFRARALGIPFYLADAAVFHQQHPVYSPPLNHFATIVQNAEVFYKKWRQWPMSGWLTQFRALGLIDWPGPEGDWIRIIKSPHAKLLAAHYRPEAAYV